MANEDSLIKTHKLIITPEEVSQLYPELNGGRRTYVDVRSPAIVERLIEVYFEKKGYTFYSNPFLDVQEWSMDKEGRITLIYTLEKY